MIRAVLANVAVTDLDSAEQWYTRLFEREPDARPMSGLIEWHLSETRTTYRAISQHWLPTALGSAVLSLNT